MNRYLIAVADYKQIGPSTFQMNGIHTEIVSAQNQREALEPFKSLKPYHTVLAVSLLEEGVEI